MSPLALALQFIRYEALLQALWPRAMNGDLKASDRVLKIMDRLNRLLGIPDLKVELSKEPEEPTLPEDWIELPPRPKPVEEMTTAERLEYMDRMMAYVVEEKAKRRRQPKLESQAITEEVA